MSLLPFHCYLLHVPVHCSTAWFWPWPGFHDLLWCHSPHGCVATLGCAVLPHVDPAGHWQRIWNSWGCHWTNHGVENLSKLEERAGDTLCRIHPPPCWPCLGFWSWILRFPDIWWLLCDHPSSDHCLVPVHWCRLGLWKWQVRAGLEIGRTILPYGDDCLSKISLWLLWEF